MKYLLVALLFLNTPSFAADFTVDERSPLHFGATFVLAATADILLAENGMGKKRVVPAWAFAFGVGVYKELFIDSSPDLGDMAFNAAGALCGVLVAERWLIVPIENGAAVVSRW